MPATAEAVLVCDTSDPRASSPRVTTDAVSNAAVSAAGGRRFGVHGCVFGRVVNTLAACKTLESGKLQKSRNPSIGP